MKKKLASLILALALLLGLAACSVSGTESQAPDSAVRTFTDDCRREVQLPESITRIVPSSSLSQTVLLALAPELLVGLADELGSSAKGILPDELFSLPVFGSLYATADLSIEELAFTAPQLIVDIGSPKPGLTEDLGTLQSQTGIPSVFIETSLETLPATYRKLGALLGREERGEQLALECEKIYERTLGIMEQVGENRLSALYVMGEDGLNVLARGSYHSEIIDMLTENAAEVDNPMAKGTGNEVTMEQIALWDPEFVIFAPDSIYDTVTERDPWNKMTAIVNGDYIQVPDAPHNWVNMPPSAQRYLGLVWLTAALYPEYCDYDAKTEICAYFELFYGCTLTDEQYESITADAFSD